MSNYLEEFSQQKNLNSLAKQRSVYLRQHAHNPVQWMSWGPEAFEVAVRENKPILVSIGYSTCHWCHVMERESFEDTEVAKLLNDNFVAIKVDREEHPDVDQFYMQALHLMTDRGGWPLNMFVTPELKPFFGGTYFPKKGFMDVLTQIAHVWKNDPTRITSQSQKVVGHLTELQRGAMGTSVSADQLAKRVADVQKNLQVQMMRQYDSVWGGFGPPPKFPRSHGIGALLRSTHVSPNSAACDAVEHTLKSMAYGGLRDHLEGGFHRYSTDEEWLVPHFEKMLYDQALLMQTYSEAYRMLGREQFYADIVLEILNFLEEKMKLTTGAWSAALDADSEGVEGKFYVWSESEIRSVFENYPADQVEDFLALHSVTPGGNWEHTNVLSTKRDVSWEIYQNPKMRDMRAHLLQQRQHRVAPVKDSKMIVSWNAWMASACLQASINLGDLNAESAKLKEAGLRVVDYLYSLGRDSWPHVVYEGNFIQGEAQLEDYAALIEALQMAALATCDQTYWVKAARVIDLVENSFRNADASLMPVSRSTQNLHRLPTTKVEEQDGATPAALSVYVGALYRQGLAQSSSQYLDKALVEISRVFPLLEEYPIAFSYLLCELDLAMGCAIKIPTAKINEFQSWWCSNNFLATQYVYTHQTGTNAYELCGGSACFARVFDTIQLDQALLKQAQELRHDVHSDKNHDNPL